MEQIDPNSHNPDQAPDLQLIENISLIPIVVGFVLTMYSTFSAASAFFEHENPPHTIALALLRLSWTMTSENCKHLLSHANSNKHGADCVTCFRTVKLIRFSSHFDTTPRNYSLLHHHMAQFFT